MKFGLEHVLAGIVLVVIVVLALMRRRPDMPPEGFVPFMKPTLWWIADVEPAAARGGYLDVAYTTCKNTQGRDFNIVPLIGRDALLAKLKNPDARAKQLPPALWRAYAVANLLDTQGGLVMDGTSTLCIAGANTTLASYVKGAEAATFGVHPDEAIVSPATAAAPGPAPYVAWSARAHHPAWSYAAEQYNALIARGPQAWNAAVRRMEMDVWMRQKALGAVVIRQADGGRLPNGQRRQLEDLFGRIDDPQILPGTVYVSYDGDALARSHEFNWFKRLSSKQIGESDFVWATLAGA
jgi:hypothetical protein